MARNAFRFEDDVVREGARHPVSHGASSTPQLARPRVIRECAGPDTPEEVVMLITRDWLLPRRSHPRSPVARRVVAERLFQHTSWVQRKPGAMWDAVPAAPRATAR